MTDEQRVRLIRQIWAQVQRHELSPDQAMTMIALVLDPGPLTYKDVALAVRRKIAHLGK